MKAIFNLIFLLLMLLCISFFLYLMHAKTDALNNLKKTANSSISFKDDSRIRNLELARPKKENAEPKTHEQSALAQPPRRFGQGQQVANPNSQSLLSQPPRRLGQNSTADESHEEIGSIDSTDE